MFEDYGKCDSGSSKGDSESDCDSDDSKEKNAVQLDADKPQGNRVVEKGIFGDSISSNPVCKLCNHFSAVGK